MLQLVALEKPFNDQVKAYSQTHLDRLREYKISPIKEGDVNPETIGISSLYYNIVLFTCSLLLYLNLRVFSSLTFDRLVRKFAPKTVSLFFRYVVSGVAWVTGAPHTQEHTVLRCSRSPRLLSAVILGELGVWGSESVGF